jgi:hypothetical protein
MVFAPAGGPRPQRRELRHGQPRPAVGSDPHAVHQRAGLKPHWWPRGGIPPSRGLGPSASKGAAHRGCFTEVGGPFPECRSGVVLRLGQVRSGAAAGLVLSLPG